MQKYRLYLKKVTAPIDTSRKPISKSRIGNARKAIQLAATSTQQLMTENSNSVTAHNDELVAPFQRDPKDKIFTDMLSYHLSREYRDRINNFYSIMNSNMQITNASNNVQSSIMVHIHMIFHLVLFILMIFRIHFILHLVGKQ